MFDLGNIVGSIAKAVLPSIISAEFPITALIPGLNNMIADAIGDALSKAIDGELQKCGNPAFQIKDIIDMLKNVVQGQQQPCDPGVADQCQSQYGDVVKSIVDDVVSSFKDAMEKFRNENGGKGGKGGAAASSGPVSLRDLAKILGDLEAKEAQKVKDKALAADKALSESDTAVDSKASTEDQQKALDANAKNRSSQFLAMEDSKAEAQIFQALSSMVSEVMKNFGGALQTASRGG